MGLDPLDDAVFIAAHGEVHFKMMALRMDKQRLGTRELYLYRTLCDVGDEGRKMLYRHILLAAETAADQSVLNLYLFCPQEQLAFVQGLVGGLIG